MVGPHPVLAARILVGAAISALPSGSRDRYREELRSELCELGGAAQVRQAASLCRGAFALRKAVAGLDLPIVEPVPRGWRCRLGRHQYVWRRDDNPERAGRPYHACVRCGEWYESNEPELDLDKLERNSVYFPPGGIL
jgi:hypothetical protein